MFIISYGIAMSIFNIIAWKGNSSIAITQQININDYCIAVSPK